MGAVDRIGRINYSRLDTAGKRAFLQCIDKVDRRKTDMSEKGQKQSERSK